MRRLIDQLMLLAQIDAAASAQIAPEQIGLSNGARCRQPGRAGDP
jgi:hypothetical protein